MANLSWRIQYWMWHTADSFAELQRFLGDYPEIVDEVTFFESMTHHLYLPLEELGRRAEMLRGHMQAIKAMGIPRAGINVITTLGHLDEGWEVWEPLPFQPMVGHDGRASVSCACPNTPELRAYIRAKYRLFAEAGPDFIWVDDDVRMQHHGPAWPCFCPTCLEIFSRTTGRSWEREALVAALNTPGGGALRDAWVEQNVTSLETLLAEIAETVHAVDPRIATGLMTAGPAWTTYSGQRFDRWLTALRATKVRPGGGFYTDEQPTGVLAKVLDVGRQLERVPTAMTDRQYELENYPYARLSKSAAMLTAECTLALAAGLNGIAFNALGAMDGHWLDDRRPLMEAVRAARPQWEALVNAAADYPLGGLWPAWSADLMRRRQVKPGESWLAYSREHDISLPLPLAEIGLPLCANPSGDGVILSGRVIEAFTDDELRAMFRGAVLLDADALAVLEARGLGELAGARIARRVDNGVFERFAADPLNGEFADFMRYVNLEFWAGFPAAAVLQPLNPETRVLGTLEQYTGAVLGPCLTVSDNTLGGRAAVLGFAPWAYPGSTARRTQLLNVADWITRETLPVRIAETVKLVPFTRLAPDCSRGAIVLCNAGLDPIVQATVHVRGPQTPVRLYLSGADPVSLPTSPTPGGWQVILRDLAPWQVAVLVIGEFEGS